MERPGSFQWSFLRFSFSWHISDCFKKSLRISSVRDSSECSVLLFIYVHANTASLLAHLEERLVVTASLGWLGQLLQKILPTR